jgi:uncharacterized LabA/DUF88 family protein
MTRPRVDGTSSSSGMTGNKPAEAKKDTEKTVKGNIDADLVLWAMKEVHHYSKAVIVSGDGDFYALVEYLDQQKKLAALLVPNPHYSSLYNAYDRYVERLDAHKGYLQYRPSKTAAKKSKR